MTRVVWLLGFAGTLGLLTGEAQAQAAARVARFEITAVGDTTLSFRVTNARWVKPGQAGTALDPRRRDAMVARFQVIAVRNNEALALVTGQTTAVSTDHVATVPEPRRSWVKSRSFWGGLLLGGALGAAAVSVQK